MPDGRVVEVWEFKHANDPVILSEWAKHFRNHYCIDEELDDFIDGTGLSKSEYLERIKFPDSRNAPGPSIRAGDFGEILLSDYLEYVRNFWVPRTRYSDKTVRNESTKGSDIIGFKYNTDHTSVSPKDILAVFEAKAQFSGDKPKARLNDAVDGSIKDAERIAESLNAIKQRLRAREGKEVSQRISRFQNNEDNPFTYHFGAVALFTSDVFDPDHIIATTTSAHAKGINSKLLVVHGVGMMELVHKLYTLACHEA